MPPLYSAKNGAFSAVFWCGVACAFRPDCVGSLASSSQRQPRTAVLFSAASSGSEVRPPTPIPTHAYTRPGAARSRDVKGPKRRRRNTPAKISTAAADRTRTIGRCQCSEPARIGRTIVGRPPAPAGRTLDPPIPTHPPAARSSKKKALLSQSALLQAHPYPADPLPAVTVPPPSSSPMLNADRHHHGLLACWRGTIPHLFRDTSSGDALNTHRLSTELPEIGRGVLI